MDVKYAGLELTDEPYPAPTLMAKHYVGEERKDGMESLNKSLQDLSASVGNANANVSHDDNKNDDDSVATADNNSSKHRTQLAIREYVLKTKKAANISQCVSDLGFPAEIVRKTFLAMTEEGD
jgi:hypothetical protein